MNDSEMTLRCWLISEISFIRIVMINMGSQELKYKKLVTQLGNVSRHYELSVNNIGLPSSRLSDCTRCSSAAAVGPIISVPAYIAYFFNNMRIAFASKQAAQMNLLIRITFFGSKLLFIYVCCFISNSVHAF